MRCWCSWPGRARRMAIAAFVTLRLQVWIKELRRMVARVTAARETVDLRSDADLAAAPGGLYLPLVAMQRMPHHGLAVARRARHATRSRSKRDEIYNTWFARRPEAVRLYPRDPQQPLSRREVDGRDQHLCASCGNLQEPGEKCDACAAHRAGAGVSHDGHRGPARVATWRFRGTTRRVLRAVVGIANCWSAPAMPRSDRRSSNRAGPADSTTTRSSSRSPILCRMLPIGRASSALVPTRNTVRTALAKAIDQLATPVATWSGFLAGLDRLTDELGSPLHMAPEDFVAEFIGPDMMWQRDWADELVGKDRLPARSQLPARVRKRLGWQAVSEFTYLSHRGRNLDRIGKATVSVPIALVQDARRVTSCPRFASSSALSVDEALVTQWLWGFLRAPTAARSRVASTSSARTPRMATYGHYSKARDAANGCPCSSSARLGPVFLTLGRHRDFDSLVSKPRPGSRAGSAPRSGSRRYSPRSVTADLYALAIDAL